MKKVISIALLCMLLCGCAHPTQTIRPSESNVTNMVTLIPTDTASPSAEIPTPTPSPTPSLVPGNTQSVEPGPSATEEIDPQESETASAGIVTAQPNTPTPTPTVTPTATPTVKPVGNKVLEDFETGSATECVRSVDWPSVGFGFITNPIISIADVGYEDGSALKVKLPDSGAWAQNFYIENDKVISAFTSQRKYFRVYVSNQTGGTVGIGVAIFTADNKKACYAANSAVAYDVNGNKKTFEVGDPSDMGNGVPSAVLVEDGFEGWIAFDAGIITNYWSDPIVTDTKRVEQICIDVRPENFVDGSYYAIDDICFATEPYEKKEVAPEPTPETTPDPDAFEIIGPAAGSVDIYKGESTDLLIGIDQFGRTFDVQVGEKKDKQVGMFFWLWNGFHRMHNQQNDNYDATKILAKYGKDVLFKQDVPGVSPLYQFHFWGEPLWGYYDERDEWVIRRQMELLTNAGVDFIVFDTTNGWSYSDVYMRICKVISQMINDGADPPRIAFYTHSLSLMVINEVYRDLYKKNLYPETWYYLDGKPLIIGYTTPEDDMKEAASRGDTSYNAYNYRLSSEILNFFTFKFPQWPSEPFYANGFPWIEWKYPQPMHNGVMNVSVASHPMVPMSFSLTRDNWTNWGRGYNVTTKKNVSADAEKGTFFQSQWETVFKNDPDIVFVDGWNEWIAIKSPYDGEYMLCDAASMEYSRDIEMMKGGYNDAFYIQLVKNIRKYKGKSLTGEVSSTQKTIDINAGVSQWSSVNSVYKGVAQTSIARNHASAGNPNVIYKQAAARNNIQQVKVTRDSDNFYFLIECKSNITGSGEEFMNLFIGTGELSDKGWNGYEYVINRSINGSDSTILKLKSDFSGTSVGTAKVNVTGKYMQIAVPRSAIGMEDSNSFYFKVADNITDPADIMDYYVSGKSFPLGRLSYRYLG